MKILSWNIWIDGYLDQVHTYLKNSTADIIALQEVAQEKDGSNNIAKIVAEELGYDFIFDPTMEGELNGKIVDWGKAILSKYKITEHKTHELSQEERRTALEATIQVNGISLHVFSVHLLHTHQQDNEIQTFQVENLIKVLPKKNVLVMGDFNATPDSIVIKKMKESLNNVDPKSAPTWSVYVKGCPVCKLSEVSTCLDYIFVSKDIKVKSFEVGNSTGSDHLPILAEITI